MEQHKPKQNAPEYVIFMWNMFLCVLDFFLFSFVVGEGGIEYVLKKYNVQEYWIQVLFDSINVTRIDVTPLTLRWILNPSFYIENLSVWHNCTYE